MPVTEPVYDDLDDVPDDVPAVPDGDDSEPPEDREDELIPLPSEYHIENRPGAFKVVD